MLEIQRVVPKTVNSAVLLLHGLGADGQDLINLADAWAPTLPNTAFFAPDAPEPCDMAPFGYQWFSLRDWTTEKIIAGLKTARPIVDTLIDDMLKEFSLSPSHFVLGGFSQGAMLALYTGLQRKEQLAGILAYSGALAGIGEGAAPILTRPPVLIVHGTQDTVVPFSASQIAGHLLEKENLSAELHLIEGLGHGIDGEGLDLGLKFLQRVLQGS